MTSVKHPRRAGMRAYTAGGLLLLLALTGCSPVDSEKPAPPSATSSTAAPTQTAAPAQSVAPAPTTVSSEPPALAASDPVVLEIPTIGLRSELISLGLRENRSLEVPQDTGNGAPAGWYNGSPTPGERGPSVVLGHVNALGGNKGVFADLRALTAGSDIEVARADGSTVVFTVDRAATYSKGDFPTFDVYGNTAGPELRLITCDGYNAATGLFDDNYVVYAKLKT
ncbi:sortase domain-containing protein [Paenarthrobacter sp. FR1]|uniref:sortase domain-containing protein n=1 Tax=Paenarthrobacter sp. FR1 TaxID=3439548 RepID=UPI003DA22AFC